MDEQLKTPLSDRFDAALVLAHRIHRQKPRKGTYPQIPYVAHVLGVTGLVLEYGGNETQAIAALLHDAIEDAPPELGTKAVKRLIRYEFGEPVLQIVEHCTDAFVHPKPAWLERKTMYLRGLENAPVDALLVSAADKLHNVQAVLRDYRTLRDDLWSRFNKDAGRTGTLGYYRAIVEALRPRLRNSIVADLDRVLTILESEAGGRCPWPPSASVGDEAR